PAHQIEDTLMPLREATGVVPRAVIERTLGLLDRVASAVAALDAPVTTAGTTATPAPAASASAVSDAVRLVRTDAEEVDALTDGLIEVGVQLSGVRRGLARIDRMRQLAEALHAELGAPAAQKREGRPASTRLRGLAEELGTAAGALARELGDGTTQMERELRQVRDVAERLRLISGSTLFVALERAARDAASSVGKSVSFAASGGKLRLEAETLSALQGAMIQAVRNAVAHGIESEDERRAAGKPPVGKIQVSLEARGSRVAFRCEDDGRGIDLEAVRRAVERRSGPAAASMGRDELLAQLLRGGISTAAGVSTVSGRGIGLDVIRETVARLRGEVHLDTAVGRGTSFEIVVPVSSAASEVLIVEAGGQVAAIPLDGVRETLRLPATDIAHAGDGDSIVHGGEAIPFMPLVQCLVGKATLPRLATAWSVVVVEHENVRVAIGVDRLRGIDSLVYRALPDAMAVDQTVAGASLDAEGNPRVVLDAAGLVTAAQRVRPTHEDEASERAPILIIDDSLTTRMLEQSILESAGYRVETATCAEEGFEMAHQRNYGLFLVDVEMPGMDGFTFVERSRADRTIGHIPAILVTSRSSPEDRKRGELVGASGYIVKGEFDQNALLERIRTLVG
ncbi:MAG TPA: response regulator, partial [Polyangia bacterium]